MDSDLINKAVRAEGWFISQTMGTMDVGDYRIERDDEMNVIATDPDAWAHVVALAKAGSAVHRAALEFIVQNNESEWEEICKKCPDAQHAVSRPKVDGAEAIDLFRNKFLEAMDESARAVFPLQVKKQGGKIGAYDSDLPELFKTVDSHVKRLADRYRVTME